MLDFLHFTWKLHYRYDLDFFGLMDFLLGTAYSDDMRKTRSESIESCYSFSSAVDCLKEYPLLWPPPRTCLRMKDVNGYEKVRTIFSNGLIMGKVLRQILT